MGHPTKQISKAKEVIANVICICSLSVVWSSEAIQSLFHFMRCSQLEYGHGAEGHPPIQELVYERPYMVLPPIMEWVRVATCFAEHRNSCVVDDNDVLQAARYPILA